MRADTEAQIEPDAILLDLDGTLIDTFDLYMECFRRVLTPIIGYSPTDAALTSGTISAERGILRLWMPDSSVEDSHAELCRHYEALHSSHAGGFYEGVREMLAALRAAGVPLGLVTGKSRAAWEITARHVDLGHFAVLVTEDEVDDAKPHPAGLLRAAAELGSDPGRLVYVGDSIDDLRAARAAGMWAGAALWPKTAPGERARFLEAIRGLKPDRIFDRPADLVRSFAGWC